MGAVVNGEEMISMGSFDGHCGNFDVVESVSAGDNGLIDAISNMTPEERQEYKPGHDKGCSVDELPVIIIGDDGSPWGDHEKTGGDAREPMYPREKKGPISNDPGGGDEIDQGFKIPGGKYRPIPIEPISLGGFEKAGGEGGSERPENPDKPKEIEKPREIEKPVPNEYKDIDDLPELFKKNLKKLDKDGDGQVSKAEIDRAMQSGEFRGEDAQLVAALKVLSQNSGLIDTNKDGRFSEAEILNVKAQSLKTELGEQIRDYAKRNFSKLDADGNGYITDAELEKAIAHEPGESEERGLLIMMRLRQQEIADSNNDEWDSETSGITSGDLEHYVDPFEHRHVISDGKGLRYWINDAMFRTKVAYDSPRRLYSSPDNPIHSITPEAVRQGRIGNCYLMASLAAMASTRDGKQAILRMIEKNSDGSYTVTFPGKKPIRVGAPTAQELGLYSQQTHCGVWPAVLEKAYGVYRAGGHGQQPPQDATDGGGYCKDAMAVLAGREFKAVSTGSTSAERLHQVLTDNVRRGTPITAASVYRNSLARGEGIVKNHAYTIIGYDPVKRRVTLRNPWGRGEPEDKNGRARDGSDDGTFTVSLEHFRRYYARLNVQKR